MSNYSKQVVSALKKAKLNIGERIVLTDGKNSYEGLLMPRVEAGDRDSIVLKLDSGYNIGIKHGKETKLKKSRTSEPKEVEEEAEFEFGKWRAELKKKASFDPRKPTISILHTGGTIASRVDYKTGGVVSSFEPEDLIAMFPELTDIANVKSRLIRNMWSQDMRFFHYNLLAREIVEEIKKGVDGIIVSHGTDTMHYTSAALAFILEGLTTPVILTGSQRSSDRASSDAAQNILNAAYFALNSNFGEVGICMHEGSSDGTCSILPATKTRKLHTSSRDAFRAVNSSPWASVDFYSKKIEFLRDGYVKRDKSVPKLKLFKEDIKVGVLRQRTNMFAAEFSFFKNYDGLIVESTGMGQLPTSVVDKETSEHKKIFNAIKKLIDSGVIVALSAQTIFGRLNLNVYENQRKVLDIGVLGNLSDMTTDTAYLKLAWLLSNYSADEARELFGKNLRGEISERSETDTIPSGSALKKFSEKGQVTHHT